MTRNNLKLALGFCVCVSGCSGSRPAPETAAAIPYGEDEFAARAAALQKTCELAAVYLGTDDARAAAVVEQGRAEAREAVRRAPDAYRRAVFGRALQRLDGAAATLAGVGDYAPPLTAAEYERLRGEFLLAADELRPLGEPYYLKVARRYEGWGGRRVVWGPLPPSEARRAPGPRAAAGPPPEPQGKTPPSEEVPPVPPEANPPGE